MSDIDELLLMSRARDAWNAAKREDDETMREASERRLANAWPKPRVAPRRAFAFGMAAAFAVAALLFFVVRPAAPPVVANAPASGASTPNANASSESAALVPPGTPMRLLKATTTRKPTRIVATSACRECRIEPGAALEERVVVPAGARLTLGFAFDDGLVDPTVGADLVGPASATAGPDASLTIERGVVRVRAPGHVVIDVPGGSVRAKDAIYTVRITERGVSRIDVERGRVAFVKGEDDEIVVPVGGMSFETSAIPSSQASQGPVTASVLPTATAGASAAPIDARTREDDLADARTRARNGDASGRGDLEKLASSSDARVARRAAFTLAELDLAGGNKDKARARLDELVVGPESSLGADAATLLARSYSAPAERAEVWRRYLATSPTSPYAERAQLERADALLDAGRTADAKKVLDELRSRRLTETQQKQMDRLLLKAR